jgi:hypothetical protein
MAKSRDLRALVEGFAAQLELAVREHVNREFARRFDDLRTSILKGARRPPLLTGGSARLSARSLRRPGPKAALKPCPVCKVPNKARRFSYLCDKHRSADNLKKFKGAAARTGAEAPAPAAVPAPAAAKASAGTARKAKAPRRAAAAAP